VGAPLAGALCGGPDKIKCPAASLERVQGLSLRSCFMIIWMLTKKYPDDTQFAIHGVYFMVGYPMVSTALLALYFNCPLYIG
jgi:hypothetical protein